VWKRIVTPITQVQFRLDAAHAMLQFPIAVTSFSVVVSWWSVAIAGPLTFAWDWSIPRGPDDRSLAQLIGLGDSAFARIGLQTALGLLGVATLPFVVRGCAWISAAFSRLLLTGVAEMRNTIGVLTEQKAAAVSAEAAALRRLERDIHDGPQQRLVRLAMDLGRGRQQLDSDPEALRTTLDEAIAQTRDTLDALQRVAGGGTVLDPEVVAQLIVRRCDDPLRELTEREREVLALMAEGRSNGNIAKVLVVGDGTVEKHVGNIFTKLALPPDVEQNRRVLAVLAHLRG
jgi:signal transduction histidine kinase